MTIARKPSPMQNTALVPPETPDADTASALIPDDETFAPILTPDDELVDLMRMFHENTKIQRYQLAPGSVSKRVSTLAVNTLARLDQYQPAPGGSGITLPGVDHSRDDAFWGAVWDRRSAPGFSGEPISVQSMSDVLAAGVAVTRPDFEGGLARRAATSGGAIYPLDVYLSARNVNGLAPGNYYLSPETWELHSVGAAPSARETSEALAGQTIVEKSAALIVLAGVFPRFLWKYGARGYRMMLLEAGHIAHGICLSATYAGLESRLFGGFVDDLINAMFRLDSRDTCAVYAIALGSS
jgi:SagB-type dehydrogenase family enzyme